MPLNTIHETAVSIVECIESMASAVTNACISAINAINMLIQAEGGSKNHPAPSRYNRTGHDHAQTVSTYADGTKGRGLPHTERNAVRSEYGQQELTIYPNGTAELTTSPIMSDLPKGTVVYNEEQTKKILHNKPAVSGNVYADGTAAGAVVTPDGRVHTPYDPDKDDSYFSKLYKAWNAYYVTIDKNVNEIRDSLTQHLLAEHNQQMMNNVSRITNSSSNVVNNRNVQPVVHNEFHVTLPNVNNATAAETLLKDLESLATKKMQVNW